MLDLVAVRFPLVDRSAEQLEGFQEERGDKVRLQPPGVSAFHLLADLTNSGNIHRVVGERPPLEKSTSVLNRMQVDTAEMTRWFLMPQGKEYKSFRITRHGSGGDAARVGQSGGFGTTDSCFNRMTISCFVCTF